MNFRISLDAVVSLVAQICTNALRSDAGSFTLSCESFAMRWPPIGCVYTVYIPDKGSGQEFYAGSATIHLTVNSRRALYFCCCGMKNTALVSCPVLGTHCQDRPAAFISYLDKAIRDRFCSITDLQELVSVDDCYLVTTA